MLDNKKTIRKGDIMLRILDLLEKTALNALDITAAIVGSYKSSRALHRALYKAARKRDMRSYHRERLQRYYRLLNHLKEQGLVMRMQEKRNGRSIWKITKQGQAKRKLLHQSPERYSIIPGTEIKIVAFDIPERQKKQRDWLRAVLKHLKFTLVQRSVWIGTTILPEELIDDLHDRALLSCVQIFSITKKGTLENILLP